MTTSGRQRRVLSSARSAREKSRRQDFQRRALFGESLEQRAVMDGAAVSMVSHPFWNVQKPLDVNADGKVTAFDVIPIINELNRAGARSLAGGIGGTGGASGGEEGQGPSAQYYYDVNNDNRLTAMDAIRVINRLNNPSAGEGEPMLNMTVDIVAAGTNDPITTIAKGGFYDVRILTQDLGVLTYNGQTRPGGDELGVITGFFDLLYDFNKTDFQVNEVQNIAIANGANNGNFTLTVNDNGTLKTTGNILYVTDRAQVTKNIQTALDTLLGPNVVEVARVPSTNQWRVRFINRLSNADIPMMTGANVSLGGTATITISETLKGDSADHRSGSASAAALADAFRIRTFYDTDSIPLNAEPPFFQDQRTGNPDANGINDVGGSNFASPWPGGEPQEIVRLRMTADEAGLVPFTISFADVNPDLRTGLVGFDGPLAYDTIVVMNDSITITEPLTAGDDVGTTTEGATANVDIVVTTNDHNNPLPELTKTVQSVTQPAVGSASVLNGTTVRFTPPGGDFSGPVTFTYTVTDTAGNTDTATVTVNITPVNDAPTFVTPPTPTSQTFNEDTARVFSQLNGNQILISDVDSGSSLMTLTLNVGAGNGTLTLAGTNGLTNLTGNGTSSISVQGTQGDLNVALDGLVYQPTQNLNGTVTLAMTVNDNSTVVPLNQQVNRNITLNITAVNDAPNVELAGVVGTPSVVEGDPLVLNATNNALIQVSDVDAASNPVQVTLHVSTGNTLHINPTAGVTISAGTNDTNNVILTGTVANINTALNGMIFNPAIGSPTPESLQITVNDQGNVGTGGSLSDTDTVTIDVDPSTRPRARNDALTVTEDSLAGAANTVDVLLNDIPNDGSNKVLVSFQTSSLHGGTITQSGNSLVYVPAPNYFGPDSFTYVMNDDSGLGGLDSSATVNVTVTEVNDLPVAIDDTISNIAEDSGARTITAATLIGNDNPGPLEGTQSLTITSAGSAVGGTVSVVSGNVVFTPTLNYNGPASFTYTITDNGTTNGTAAPLTATATVNFTITEVNDLPTASNQTLSAVAEDTATVTIPFATLLAGATPGPSTPASGSETSQALTISGVSAPVGGTVSISGSDVIFTPTANFNGAASFSFTVTDNGTTNGAADPQSVTRTASFTITPVNDAPTTVNDSVTISEGQIIDINVTGNDRDVDVNPPTGTAGSLQAGTTTSIVTNANPAEGTASVNANGTIKFTPAAGFFGVTSFTYQLDDHNSPNPTSAPATVTVTVTELNDAPVANNDSATLAEDPVGGSVQIDVLANDTDSDTPKTQWSVTILTQPQHGTASFDTATRTITYTPTANYNGPDSFTYRVNDQSTIAPLNLDSGIATVNITVTEVNDAPIGGTDPTATGRYTVIKDRDFTWTPTQLTANDQAGPANESAQTLTITAVDALSDEGGTITFSGGVITYTPPVGFVGTDFFTYTVTDNGTTNGAADPKSTVVTVRLDVVDFIPTDVNGFVYRDVNANGVYNVGVDYPLSGVEVTLSGTSDITGAITPITVETNYLGFYEFQGVQPGTYHITEAQPLGLADGAETAGAAASVFSNDDIRIVLPLLGLPGSGFESQNNFAEGGVDANKLVNSSGLVSELLASSTRNGFVLATTLAGDAYWSWALQNWGGTASMKVTLDADKTAATLDLVDTLGGTYSVRIYQNPNDPRNANRLNPDASARLARFRILGWDALGNYIIRIDAKASDWFGAGTPLAAAPAPLSAGEYVEGVDGAMAEENWA